MPRAVTSHRFTLSDLVLKRWPTVKEHAYWQEVTRASAALFPYSFFFWEFHFDHERVDLSVGVALSSREKKRLGQWLRSTRSSTQVSARARAMLSTWSAATSPYTSVLWEQDTPTGAAGLFVTVSSDASFSDTLRAAHERFGLSERLFARAHDFCAQLKPSLRPIALGSFARPGTPQELRLILRPTQKSWLQAFPHALRTELQDLLAQIPAQSDVNIALGIGEDRISCALEARYTADPVPNAAWEKWLDVALPERNALQREVLAYAFEEPLWFVPDRLPSEILLDAFVQPSDVAPVVQVRISHVKIQRTSSGRWLRKLYLRGDVLWLQLGTRAG